MPRYEFICNCSEEQKIFTVKLSISDYKSEIPCPCGDGLAKRKFGDVTVTHGLTANEKKFGTTNKRKEMAEGHFEYFCHFLLYRMSSLLIIKDNNKPKFIQRKSYVPAKIPIKENDY